MGKHYSHVLCKLASPCTIAMGPTFSNVNADLGLEMRNPNGGLVYF